MSNPHLRLRQILDGLSELVRLGLGHVCDFLEIGVEKLFGSTDFHALKRTKVIQMAVVVVNMK